MKKLLTDKLKKAEEKRNAYYFCIRKHDNAELVGFARILDVLSPHQVGFLHIDFGSEADLDQYGEETLCMMLRYGFMEANLHRLEVSAPAYETRWIELLEKNGFLREVQRREAVFHNGQYFDDLVYGMVKPDYKKLFVEVEK